MSKNQELNLSAVFAENMDIKIPDWLMRSNPPIKCFYSTMKLWDRLKIHLKDLDAPQDVKVLFPVLKHQTHSFPEILGFCEVRPEMLKMIKTALYSLTFGCIEENKDELNLFRYHYALNTAFGLMAMPRSEKCRRPEFMTEDGQVEKALSSTIQSIFKIVVDQMRFEDQEGHIDYMIYACSHFASPDARYSKAGKNAIKGAFKDYYAHLPPDERAMITKSKFYESNVATQDLIDELVTQARSQIAVASFQSTLKTKDRKLV